jgi:hypothetical protein
VACYYSSGLYRLILSYALMKTSVDIHKMIELFNKIRESFSHLDMKLDANHPQVDLNMDIPKQDGLAFEININLQGDELHLVAGHFWCEWFPCTDNDKAHVFYDNVCGLLSGRYRIVEYYRGNRAIKARLHKPNNSEWETIGTWSTWYIPLPLKTEEKIIMNV